MHKSEPTTRLLVLAVCLAVCAIGWKICVQDISAPGERPAFDLHGLPKQLGAWQGTDLALATATEEVLGAHNYISRTYQDAQGHAIGLHIAVWVNDGAVVAAPHHPEVCYPGAGWKVVRRSRDQAELANGPNDQEVIEFSKENMTEYTCHWFQLGPLTYHDHAGYQRQRFQLAGRPRWPATIKVLLSLRKTDSESASRLSEFAYLVRRALQELIEEHPSASSVPLAGLPSRDKQ